MTLQQMFLEHGYNTRIFDPEGQDDIGGGCGQLWFVQKWLKRHIVGEAEIVEEKEIVE